MRNSFCATILLLTGFVTQSAHAQSPIRIMPLGDSITYGSGAPGGYRYPLYVALTNAGYHVDYVGTQTGNATAGLGTEVNHEGHGGWRISNVGGGNGLYEYLYGWFEQIEDPHVVLIHAGTNDSNDPDFEHCINELDALVTRVAQCQPDARIIVTTLMKRGADDLSDPRYIAITNDFNPYVYPLVTNHQARGENVSYLDMHAYVELADMDDNLHPNAVGYQKMADAWFPAITNIIGTHPGPNRPAPIRAPATVDKRTTAVVTFNKALSTGTATNTANYAIDGGLVVTGAVLNANQRTVTLATTLQADDRRYTITMNGLADQSTPDALQVPADSRVEFTSPAHPVALSATGGDDHRHVAILFSKPVSPATATDLGNYAIDGDLAITGASLSADQLTVTLATSEMSPGTEYTITINDIADECTPVALTVPANSQLSFTPRTPRGYENNVAESASYQLVYSVDLPTTANYRDNVVLYSVDNSARIDDGHFDRIAYYLELQKAGEDLQYLWVSMNAFTDEADKIGFPTIASGAVYQQYVHDLNVFCNVTGVTNGTGQEGNLEFWPLNYSSANAAGIPGASGSLYDYGDEIHNTGYHGSMQIHRLKPPASGETLMAVNNWGGGGTLAVGMGNSPGTNPDWTFANNSGDYTIKTLQVLVQYHDRGDTTGPGVLSADVVASEGLVLVYFDEHLAAASVVAANFAISDGVMVNCAERLSDGRTVKLTTTSLPALPLVLTINGVRDAAANLIAPNTTVPLGSSIPPEIASNIGTNTGQLAHGYELIYSLDIPVYSTFGSTVEHYDFNRSAIPMFFDRIAYYLELTPANGAAPQYVWTSMDAFTDDIGAIGVPTFASGHAFQQAVTHLDVQSNVAGVTNGTGMAGYIEFWPNNYTAPNALGVPGASDTLYDFGDTRSADGSHGSMQIHDTQWSQSVLCMNNWGANGQNIAVGIGNRTSSHPDWTFANNAQTFVKRRMHILVRPATPAPPPLPPEVAANITGAEGYYLAYTLDLPVKADFWSNAAAYYSVNNVTNGLPRNFSRVAYYLQLVSGATTNFIWTAMDAFTGDASRIGVPVSGTHFRSYVRNLEVQSNVAGITNGSGIVTGNVEFWPSNYNAGNDGKVPNASTTAYDFGDGGSGTGEGYGSMQVHNYDARQTLFAVNNFNNSNTLCIGIGNQPTGNPDYTFANNAGNYDSRRMHIFILPGGDGDGTPPALNGAIASRSLDQVTVRFSEPMADTAADPLKYSIDGGVSVADATLRPDRRDVVLTTTPLIAGQTYTLSVAGICDRSINANPLAPYSVATFTAPRTTPLPDFLTNVAEVAEYELVYQLAVANTTSYANGCNYSVDESSFLYGTPFDRIAYCMELETGGVKTWAWASMDAFSTDRARIGVPTADRKTAWQIYVNNMNVYASANAAVTTGVGIATGNIEFWPSNYNQQNTAAIPGASATTYDFGDGGFNNTTPGHGSMQIHNYALGQTIMSMVSFGSNGRTPGLGIGNNPVWSNNDPDWTFTYNAASYTTKNIYVFVREGLPDPTGTPPEIWSHPFSLTVDEGETAKLNVYSPDATGYQWRKNGAWLLGATSSWIEFAPSAATDSATYDVVVSASDGSVAVSRSAVLHVIPDGTSILIR